MPRRTTIVSVRVTWSRLARDALLDIYLTFGLHNQNAAERVYDRLEERAEQLREHPKMGPGRPDIRPGARVLVEPPYLILYEIVSDTDDAPVAAIQIVAVLDGRRDLTLGI